MDTMRDLDLVRAVTSAPSVLRADGAGDAGLGTLEVRFSPFGVWYEVNSWWEGNFMERTVRGAFSKTMAEALGARTMPVKMLYDHGFDPSIGNKPLAPVESLAEEKDSAVASGPLLDTTYVRDLIPGLQAGVYGSSFRFRVIQESWNDEPPVSDHNPKGIPERSVTEIRLYEQGPVTFPANPAATAGVRSLTDTYYDRLHARNPELVEGLRDQVRAIRTPDCEAAARRGTVIDLGAARKAAVEPAAGHSGGYGVRERRALIHRLDRST